MQCWWAWSSPFGVTSSLFTPFFLWKIWPFIFIFIFYFLIIRVWGLWRLTLDGDPFCTAECLIFFEFYFVGVGHYLSFVFWVWRVSGPRNQLKGWLVDWIGASHDCSRLWLYTRVGSHPTWFAPCFGFKVRVFGTWICGFIFHFPFQKGIFIIKILGIWKCSHENWKKNVRERKKKLKYI